ncbi:MAG TPA: aminotransferase class I/II-fold pyridoxal phosphate-dependent enzyme [Woeseiaceae bacterium]|nr:aminotransferase class I/II-fold pyridoxal phosphate-dependent enzyme [Woeseiaceae bacterium]
MSAESKKPESGRIRELEALARRLDPDPATRARWREAAVAYTERMLEELGTLPAYRPGFGDPGGALAQPFGEEPTGIDELLATLEAQVLAPGINPASPGHLAYIPGGGLYPAALGDLIADITNRYAGVFFAAPGAVRLEMRLVSWLAELVGYPAATAGGDLTSGGSIANLSAIVAAREAHDLRSTDLPRRVVYLSEQCHHSVQKALRIAGLGECVRRLVAVDERWRMRPNALERAIEADRAANLLPWFVVATAGTTDTGAIDPLADIAEVAAAEGLWLHVDAAYGGAFLLCDEGRRALAGIERSDSAVIDPHKGLFLPFGSGALLVRDRERLAAANRYHANYMQDAVRPEVELSPADLSPELSRPFRGLRLWLPLKLCGLAPFRAALEEKLMLARHFHTRLSALPGWEVGPAPDLSVVTYRYRPPRGDADDFNRRLIEAVQQDGRVFISSTRLEGRFTLRLAVLHFRTHLAEIELALELLQHYAKQLAMDPNA